ncbi:MAG: hypothetical protein NTY07_16215 [Bacteroidia bacterium]|nr:hypothetical protein [Bacteroidia bacterium]
MAVSILSYHGWEVSANVFEGHLEQLYANGFRGISMEEIPHCSNKKENFFVITTDDGNIGDLIFAGIAQKYSIPVYAFVNSESISSVFVENCITQTNLIIEDHGFNHSAIIIWPEIIDLTFDPSPIFNFQGLSLKPKVYQSGYLSSTSFIPHKDFISFLKKFQESNYSFESVVKSGISQNVIKQKRNKLYIKGDFETYRDFKFRCKNFIEQGIQTFTEKFNKQPSYFAYSWWLGSEFANVVLKCKKYKGSFANAGKSITKPIYWNVPRCYIGNTIDIFECINHPKIVNYHFNKILVLKNLIKRIYYNV